MPDHLSFGDLRKKLVLTYDNTVFTDGVGAQLHRVYGTYSISRLLGAAYLHTPVGRVDYQGLTALEESAEDPEFPRAFNELLHIESDVSATDDFHHVNLRDISLDAVQQLVDLFDRDGTGGRPSLVRLVLPHGIGDRFPDCYEVCKEISPFNAPAVEGRPLRVALHVRRGELFAIASDRLLPNEYYIDVARAVADVLEALKVDYQIELWTEVPKREFAIEWDEGVFNQLAAPVVINAEMCRLDDFNELPNLVHRINGRTIDCLRELSTADILVMSRSSFSYVCGVLNRNCVVLYHPFWHSAPSGWIAVGPDGQFDDSEFSKAVQAL